MEASKYYTKLRLEPTDDYTENDQRIYIVVDDFTYHSPKYGDITVPSGSLTDMASIPPCFHFLIPKDGPYLHAAVIHDYMYQNAIMTKHDADLIMREGMRLLKVSPWRRFLIYWGVRLVGRGEYKNKQKRIE